MTIPAFRRALVCSCAMAVAVAVSVLTLAGCEPSYKCDVYLASDRYPSYMTNYSGATVKDAVTACEAYYNGPGICGFPHGCGATCSCNTDNTPVTADDLGSNTPVTFAQLRPLLKATCALGSSCHAMAVTSQGNLSLADADAYCALVGKTQGATYRSSAKGQYPHRVVASDKANSFVYQKLTLAYADSGTAKPLGTVMPLNQPLDAANIDLFARWIDAGAQNDSGTAAPAGCN